MSERNVSADCSRPILGSALAVAMAVAIGVPAYCRNCTGLYGSVTRNILDGTGAAVPGVTIAIKDEATGLLLTAVTDAAGVLRFVMSPAGRIRCAHRCRGSRNSSRPAFPSPPAASSGSTDAWKSAPSPNRSSSPPKRHS